jgi:integrase
VQAALYRIEALQGTVKVRQNNGTKPHTWLGREEIRLLLDRCEDGIVGQRDRGVLGLLVASGLRRSEAASLRFGTPFAGWPPWATWRRPPGAGVSLPVGPQQGDTIAAPAWLCNSPGPKGASA